MRSPKAVIRDNALALKYMCLIAISAFALCVSFVLLAAYSAEREMDRELFSSLQSMEDALANNGISEIAYLELPYYVIFTIYDSESREVQYTNDPLLPLLDSGGKCRSYAERGYFSDGDLVIRYLTRHISADGTRLVAEVAIDTENDSASRALKSLPRIVLLSLLPVLAASLALSIVISRGAITQYKQLESRYDREREFTSNVSHELKTPIAVISGHANLIRRWGKDDPSQLAASITAIINAAASMSSIVTTLLEMSRLERGDVAVNRELFCVYDLYNDLRKEFASLYPKLAIYIEENARFEITSDRAKLHQIFTAVMSNSVKFAGDDCAITLGASRKDKRIELTARDDGDGFDKKTLLRAFDRFYKGDMSHNRAVSGTGLGLAIAKSLAERLGGTIAASNASPHGAVITLTLP